MNFDKAEAEERINELDVIIYDLQYQFNNNIE